MNAKSYFLSLSTTVIILNIIIGISAIFLVERIIPAINNILQENAYSVSSAVKMLEHISSSETEGFDAKFNESEFWRSYQNAKENITLLNEAEILNNIESQAKNFWAGDLNAKASLTTFISELASINLKAMKQKKNKAHVMSLTGAWGLGLLLLISIGVQLIFRSKILNGLIEPLEKILNVLKDFNGGNSLRRFTEQKENLNEIKQTGALMNNLMDKVILTKNS